MSCVQNPDYGNYNDPNAIFPNVAFFDDVTGASCYPSVGNINGGTVYGSAPKDYHITDSILATILSGFALLQHAPYVPTANNPYNQPQVTPVIVSGGGGLGGGGNNGLNPNNPSKNTVTNQTLGKFETWVKANPGVAAIGALGLAVVVLSQKKK